VRAAAYFRGLVSGSASPAPPAPPSAP
jgi:hypothetical protein